MNARYSQFVEVAYLVFLALCLVLVSSCSTVAENRVTQEVAQTPPLEPGKQLSRATKQAIHEAAPSLTPEQKKRLEELQAYSAREQKRIRQDLSRHQMVLVRTLLQPSSSEEDVRILKQRVLGLERERTNLFLDSLEKAEEILGRRSPNDEHFYRAFLQDPPQADILP